MVIFFQFLSYSKFYHTPQHHISKRVKDIEFDGLIFGQTVEVFQLKHQTRISVMACLVDFSNFTQLMN